MSKKDQAEARKIGKAPLAASGRRPRKELGMPIAGEGARLKDKGAGLDLDQDDDGRRDGDGGSRMEQDAQGAVVGIGIDRMHVRYLDNGKECQQDKAHHGND
jgi:hypothetical protein